jgi:hypothetical protein
MNRDILSHYLMVALDSLFLRNQFSTSMGAILGCIVDSIIPLANDRLIEVTGLNFAVVPLYGWIMAGIFIFNLPSWILYDKVPKDVEEILVLIEMGRKAGMSNLEIKQRYRQIIQKYMDRIVLKDSADSEYKTIQQQIKRRPQ